MVYSMWGKMNNSEKISSFTDLVVWQEAHKLVVEVYKVTKTFPKEEVFGLTSQMRRAAVSITSNISEGFGRQSQKEKTQFYSFSRSSLLELQNQLLIAKDVEYFEKDKFEKIAQKTIRVHKLLNGLIKTAKSKN